MSDKPIICSDKYGPHRTRKCTKLAKYVYTGDGKPYCGLHARKFLPAGLRPIFQEGVTKGRIDQ